MNPFEPRTKYRRSDSERVPTARRRQVIAVGASLGATLLAGCSTDVAGDGSDGSGGETPTDAAGDGESDTGTFRLLISDQPVAIDQFDSLEVTFDRARVFRGEGADDGEATDTPTPERSETPTEAEETETETATETETGTPSPTPTATSTETAEADDDPDEQQGFLVLDLDGATVDLTQVVGDKAIGVFEGELPEGRYTKIELYAAGVDGIVDGESVSVKIPSGKLQIVKPFEVAAGETLSFVFDINVVEKGQTGEYNLLPVIAKSGVVGEEVEADEIDGKGEEEASEETEGGAEGPSDDSDGDDGRGNGDGGGDGNGPPDDPGDS